MQQVNPCPHENLPVNSSVNPIYYSEKIYTSLPFLRIMHATCIFNVFLFFLFFFWFELCLWENICTLLFTTSTQKCTSNYFWFQRISPLAIIGPAMPYFLTILNHFIKFSPFWTIWNHLDWHSFKIMGNFKILAKAMQMILFFSRSKESFTNSRILKS